MGLDPASGGGAGGGQLTGTVVSDVLAFERSTAGAVEYDSIGAVVDHGAVEAPESEAHVPATAAFPDVGGDLVHAGLQDSASLLLAVAGAAAAGADVGDHVVVDVGTDRVITRGAEPDHHRIIGGVLDVGRRDRHYVVCAGAELTHVGVPVYQVVFAVGGEAVGHEARGGRPGGEVRQVAERPAPGLRGTEIDVPYVAGLRILDVDVVLAGPVGLGHAVYTASAATGVLVEQQEVPALGADPVTGSDVLGIDWDDYGACLQHGHAHLERSG